MNDEVGVLGKLLQVVQLGHLCAPTLKDAGREARRAGSYDTSAPKGLTQGHAYGSSRARGMALAWPSGFSKISVASAAS